MKLVTLFTLCAILSLPGWAQENPIHWRAYTGFNWSGIYSKKDPNASLKTYKAGFTSGLGASLGLAETLRAGFNLAYENKGRRLDFPGDEDVRSSFNYLTLSASLEFRPVKRVEQLSMGAGIYAAYLLEQKSVFTWERNSSTSYTDNFKRFDLGMLASARWNILSAGRFRFFAEEQVGWGLTNIHKDIFLPETVFRNRSFTTVFGLEYDTP